MLDFGQEDEQKVFASSPVPNGSKVLVKMTVEKPKFASLFSPFVAQTRQGHFQLWVKFEVAAGTYEGVSWHTYLWLPRKNQTAPLNDGQSKICGSHGAILRAILEAGRGIMPSDMSPNGVNARRMNDVLDFNNMTFPAVLGIDAEPYNKDGKDYWNNRLVRVITPDKEEYAMLRQGGEIINKDGEVVGKGKANSSNNSMGTSFPSETGSMDDIPF